MRKFIFSYTHLERVSEHLEIEAEDHDEASNMFDQLTECEDDVEIAVITDCGPIISEDQLSLGVL